MPEIAEVETVRRTLLKRIIHKKITSIDIIYPGIIENDLNYFKENLINDEFIDIKRIGKWLIFETNNKYLLSHLIKTGFAEHPCRRSAYCSPTACRPPLLHSVLLACG